jgi:tetratricopeptide (TPR) repeat protein
MKCFPVGGAETVLSSATTRAFIFASCLLAGCSSETLEKQAEQLRQQEIEIARQRKEINDLLAGQKVQDQKSRDCNRAFREYFEKAQTSSDREQAIALYREGLAVCPDDDVAHYELGKVMVGRGLYAEAEKEFEAALKINPDFVDAKKQLDTVRKVR